MEKARAFVEQLTLDELVNITTGAVRSFALPPDGTDPTSLRQGILNRCVGNTGTVERLGFKGLCLNDAPLGIRFADFVSAFPAG